MVVAGSLGRMWGDGKSPDVVQRLSLCAGKTLYFKGLNYLPRRCRKLSLDLFAVSRKDWVSKKILA